MYKPIPVIDGKPLIENLHDGLNTVALTAGASAPERLVREVIEHLQARGYDEFEETEIKEENAHFALPFGLENQTPPLGNRRDEPPVGPYE